MRLVDLLVDLRFTREFSAFTREVGAFTHEFMLYS